nr:hypothetical protein [Tepidamorphus gemmatus]
MLIKVGRRNAEIARPVIDADIDQVAVDIGAERQVELGDQVPVPGTVDPADHRLHHRIAAGELLARDAIRRAAGDPGAVG